MSEVNKILSVFFEKRGRSSFHNTTDTRTFQTLLKKVGATCMPTLKELLNQAQNHNLDKFMSVIGTLYDVCSASENGFFVLVETEVKNAKISFDDENHKLLFASKQLDANVLNMCRNVDVIKEYLVQTPSGQFQYLKQPAVSIGLPCNIVKTLVTNGFVLPVLSSGSSPMNLEERWTNFFEMKKNKQISQCLTSVTTNYVTQVAQQVVQQIGSLTRPLDDEYCSNLCIIAWISQSIKSKNFFCRSTFEAELLTNMEQNEEGYRKHRIANELKIETRQREHAKVIMQELQNEVSERLNFECCICCALRPCKAITTTLCNHSFHLVCLNQWRLVRNTCPVCRRGI
jgi:hypothetical protein